MPGWHEKTKAAVAEGRLNVAGIVEEQHGERAALFMQWKQMDWPVMVDSLNLLGVRAVPLTFLIDEGGIIRAVNPKGDALDKFLATGPQLATPEAPQFSAADEATRLAIAAINSPEADPEALDLAIAAKHEGADGQFRAGVLYRKRHDSPNRQPGDFSNAVAAWSAALEANPGQYIVRRRIQQYGPMLDKPYNFYGWVSEAQQDILARGGQPVVVDLNLSTAETASPKAQQGQQRVEHPDPDGLLPRDSDGLVRIEQTIVPSTQPGKPAFCVHLHFTPSREKGVQWNNEAGPSTVWVDRGQQPLDGIRPPAKTATSVETRSVEYFYREAPLGPLKATAFYHICEGVDGTCHYLRQDFEITFPVRDE